jgi:hypothetical protein
MPHTHRFCAQNEGTNTLTGTARSEHPGSKPVTSYTAVGNDGQQVPDINKQFRQEC